MRKLTDISKTIGFKIATPTIMVTVVFILSIIVINNIQFNKYGKSQIDKHLNDKMIDIENNLKEIEIKALWISSTLSELSIVKDAYKTYYQTDSLYQSSLIIEREFTNINSAIKLNTGDDAKIHFHLPPAISFIRCWSKKRGDDLTKFRPSVLAVSQKKSPVSGIEIGRGGFEIRGIAPIFDENKLYLGSVETLFPIDIIFKNSKMTDNEDFAIYMHTDLLSIATDFLAENESNVNNKNQVIGNLIFIKSTSDNFITDNLNEKLLNNALSEITYLHTENHEYLAFPIFNFEGKAQAVGIIQLNKSDLVSSINQFELINYFLSIILIILLILGILYFTKTIIINPISHSVDSMQKIANKQIDFEIVHNRQDEIGKLYNSINEIILSYKKIIGDISKTAEAVLITAKELDDTSKNMSEKSNEQASTIENIASSMEQMLATIKSNTDNAKSTAVFAKNAANEMSDNNEVFQQGIKSVAEIDNKIILIRDIAFKINILSLNASVEAARAGEAGAGFSVVAQEVRKLADTTKLVSQQIQDISSKGKNISEFAGQKLLSIIPEIIQSSELILKIAIASTEQKKGVEIINNSIQQLSAITQNNSAEAEKMNESAQNLSTMAEQLNQLISVFNSKTD